MGCDIHLLTEKYHKNEEKWVNVDNWRYSEWSDEFKPHEIYRGRNYTLFSILAGVRNYSNEERRICDPKRYS